MIGRQRPLITTLCRRYASPDEASIEREFHLVHTEWQFPPSFNVAPTQPVPIVRSRQGERRGSLMRWGLIPFFARGVPPKYFVARGFYEWQVQADGKTKVPFYITTNVLDVFAFAGLWDSSRTDSGESIESVTHITVPANSLLHEIHNSQHRMPAILSKDDRDAWLSGSLDEDGGRSGHIQRSRGCVACQHVRQLAKEQRREVD
jgi:putative SOS response-associated peptidase YedK